MKRFLSLAILFLLFAAQTQAQTRTQTAAAQKFTGNGGRGTSIAILAPQTTGLNADQSYLPALVQGEFVSNFTGYSAISVLDRQRLDEQYAELLSGYYSDSAGMDLGRLSPTDYIMGGNITRTATGYALQVQITKSADKMTTASYSGTFTFAELDNLTGIRRASLELLQKMGVTPTAQARTELTAAAMENHVNAQTALAQGITAQKIGNTIESLVRYYEASSYDSSFEEAVSRVNILSSSVRTGSLGQNIRNDIAWRNEWIKLYEDAAAWFRANPPVFAEYVYNPQLKQGTVDYRNETVNFDLEHGDVKLEIPSRKMLEDLAAGLTATKRASEWGLDPRSFEKWDINCVVNARGPNYWNRAYEASVELLNDKGKVLATHHCFVLRNDNAVGVNTLKIGDGIRALRNIDGRGRGVSSGLSMREEWELMSGYEDFIFKNIRVNDITDVMTVRITKIYEFVGGILTKSGQNIIPVRTGVIPNYGARR